MWAKKRDDTDMAGSVSHCLATVSAVDVEMNDWKEIIEGTMTWVWPRSMIR